MIIEVPFDVCPVGHYILVKFLEPRQSSAERLGIVGIKFYGFNRKGVFVDDFSMVRTRYIFVLEYCFAIVLTASRYRHLIRHLFPTGKAGAYT